MPHHIKPPSFVVSYSIESGPLHICVNHYSGSPKKKKRVKVFPENKRAKGTKERIAVIGLTDLIQSYLRDAQRIDFTTQNGQNSRCI